MSPQQRISIENAIWLCSNCHRKVDRDESRYSIALLKEWKDQAEAMARKELGQLLPKASDAQELLVSVFAGAPRHLAQNAIANVHGAVEQHLQALDPRFIVETSYQNKTLHHVIKPKERVPFSIKVASDSAGSVSEKLAGMFDHGAPVTLPAQDVTVTGSPLLTYIQELNSAESGHLIFTPHSKSAVLKLKLSDPVTNRVESFDDMHGTISSGTKSLTFTGRNCGKLLQMSFRKFFDAEQTMATSQFGPDFEQWDGLDVQALPYRDKVTHLFELLGGGWQMELALEIEGRELLRGKVGDSIDISPYVASVCNLLQYIDRVRLLAQHLNKKINFSAKCAVSRQEHLELTDALEMMDSEQVYSRSEISSNSFVTLIADDDLSNIKMLQTEKASELRMREGHGKALSVFGQVLELPPLEITLSSVKAHILQNVDALKVGDEVRVEFEPTDECVCIYRFISSQ